MIAHIIGAAVTLAALTLSVITAANALHNCDVELSRRQVTS